MIILRITENWKKKLMMLALCLSFSVFHFPFSICHAQTGSWRAYMAYNDVQQIVKGGDRLYVRASNGLYSYNLNDHSLQTYDKIRQLSDTYIDRIAWNPTVKKLLIIYNNYNIDLLAANDDVFNIGSYYLKTMTQSKTVNSIYIYEQYAYLCTAFGIVKINMQRQEIAESYILDRNIKNVGIANGTVYAKDNNETVISGSLADNLIDPHNWAVTTSFPSDVFNQDNTDWNEYKDLVKTLQPGGPRYNNFGFMCFKDGQLFTASGSSSENLPGTVQILKNGEWSFLPDNVKGAPGTESSSWQFVNNYAIDIDPLDNRHIFVAGRTGLFEYYDGEFKKYYNKDNSILQTATTSNKYVLVTGMSYDTEGNLWLLQSEVASNTIIEITKDGEWIKHPQELLMNNGKSLKNMMGLFQDSRGLFWFVNANWEKSAFFCYDSKTDQIVNYMTNVVNQDGTTYPESFNPHCITEDLEGNIWIGTQYGLFLIEASRIYEPWEYLTQVKVPRNDGTEYADYLLSGVNISCMAVDAGNRKWIGTNDNGVYLISSDNMEQIHHFTTENSPLFSNTIRSITINHDTGEVFFGTEDGLCSYMGNASRASVGVDEDAVYAYPNPVVSGYDGLITVVGLTYDSDVKILTTNGQLVAQGRSNGGMFTWNGRDRSGKRVASGIYMVAAATRDGKKATVTKIAFVK